MIEERIVKLLMKKGEDEDGIVFNGGCMCLCGYKKIENGEEKDKFI